MRKSLLALVAIVLFILVWWKHWYFGRDAQEFAFGVDSSPPAMADAKGWQVVPLEQRYNSLWHDADIVRVILMNGKRQNHAYTDRGAVAVMICWHMCQMLAESHDLSLEQRRELAALIGEWEIPLKFKPGTFRESEWETHNIKPEDRRYPKSLEEKQP